MPNFLCQLLLSCLGMAGLLPMRSVRLQVGALLSTDATTIAPVAAKKIILIKQPFALDENLLIGSLVPADFTGSAAKAGVAGAQELGIDPITGQQLVTINVPAGGWRWVTGDMVNLPQTIYGYALVDNAGAVLLGAAVLPRPVPLTIAGQQVDLGEVTMMIVLQPIT